MTSRIMDTANLEQIEILKGPASLMSGEGATGGAINYVTKTAPYRKDRERGFHVLRFVLWLSRRVRVRRQHGGQGTGLPLRHHPFIEHQLHRRHLQQARSNVSGQLDYRVTDNFKVWGAAEHKQDKNRFYWGTPLVPVAFSGPYATSPESSPGAVDPILPQWSHRRSHAGHDRQPHAADHLQRARQRQRSQGTVAAGRLGLEDHQQRQASRTKPIATRPTAAGSTTRSTRSTTTGVLQSTANGFRSTRSEAVWQRHAI